ncbi:hypothetical protein [Thiothrix subterranea]|uniref:Uncharacterized protein n=1 Tax=Thiothrix subterranea TaxID=2735563 RepID=A0AA51MMS8_9GAMM|nr:hypothetical protein [Thiothrix subterranea]MDQ5770896.1 hypothetical protein [Thiothrix subterranea]WML85916.1 hypothetical protein RCG00_16630 [Thiothrix subterranea]
MTPLTAFLEKYLPKPLALLMAISIYTLTLIAIIVLIGRNPDPMNYLDVG